MKKESKKEDKNLFPPSKTPEFKFIDLFAGIGGFRIALQNLGGECSFTSEWDKNAQATYFNNFGDFPFGDITKDETKQNIPENFNVLCAGFPCQPFSKGGFQNGFEDTRGTLFFDICEITDKHKPEFLFLENVSNLVTHDKGNTFKVILKTLDKLGYHYPNEPLILSPDKFGIPILRPRIYIPCVRKDIAKGKTKYIKNIESEIAEHYTDKTEPIESIIDPSRKNELSTYELKVLKMWDEFYQGLDIKVIGFPVWSEFFKYKKDLGLFPKWKATFIQKNIDLYKRNKKHIDKWLKKYDNLDWVTTTHKKLEWQAGSDYSSIFDCLIQFRPSGVRVKRPNKFSTLVAMNHQQIIGKLKRRLSTEEAKKLQSFPEEYLLSDNVNVAMKQLGNSVNTYIVELIFSILKKRFL